MNIEYIGYCGIFGSAGSHPQFEHLKSPPKGHSFSENGRDHYKLNSIGKLIIKLVRLLNIIAPTCRLIKGSLKEGAKIEYIWKFLNSRYILSEQLKIPTNEDLLFVPSFPFIVGQAPWVIEIEDVTTLFTPFIFNGETHVNSILSSPYFPIIKALLSDKSCKAIIAHVESTKKSLVEIFNGTDIPNKVSYIPIGVNLPDIKRESISKPPTLLFTNSWHQDSRSFFLRGGLDLIEAFKIVQKAFPDCRLIIKSALPKIGQDLRSYIDSNWNIKLIEHFVSKQELQVLLLESDIFILPSARLHVVSILQAMSYGLPVVVSDGWGITEYVEHERTGTVVKGRYGKCSWEGPKGTLVEDYRPLYSVDMSYSKELATNIIELINSKDTRTRLGLNAQKAIAEKYSIDNWNKGLEAIFDSIGFSMNDTRKGFLKRLEGRIVNSRFGRKVEMNQFLRKKVAIFGASLSGEKYLNLLLSKNSEVICFIDNNPLESGMFHGHSVFKPNSSTIAEWGVADYIILASAGRETEMYNQLRSLKIKKSKILKGTHLFAAEDGEIK